jgi:hypothetical protein
MFGFVVLCKVCVDEDADHERFQRHVQLQQVPHVQSVMHLCAVCVHLNQLYQLVCPDGNTTVLQYTLRVLLELLLCCSLNELPIAEPQIPLN